VAGPDYCSTWDPGLFLVVAHGADPGDLIADVAPRRTSKTERG
jgi:hypothetical protein